MNLYRFAKGHALKDRGWHGTGLQAFSLLLVSEKTKARMPAGLQG